ncbi:uncharacterized protein LOC121994805 [Zingiber officinale]|nr:uncharacterized protein LOC121994805 [Zingiber officinale]
MEEGAATRSDSVVPTEEPAERRVPVLDDDDDYEIQGLREKLMLHLQEAADRLNLMVPFLPKATGPDPVACGNTSISEESAAPLSKMRTRRMILRAHEEQGSVSRFPPSTAETRAVHFRTERQKWPKFSFSLTRDEIEEDLYSMTGCRARRRPRKRPTAVQKQIDTLFPGSRLSEITSDSYKLPDERRAIAKQVKGRFLKVNIEQEQGKVKNHSVGE